MNFNTTNNRQILLVFCFFLIVNFISSGGHLDMWDGVVTFMITESMALKGTAQLDPEIPTIYGANATSRVHLMMTHEIGHFKYLTGGYTEWISKSSPIEPVFTSRSLLMPTVAIPFYYVAHVLSLNAVSIVALSVNSLIISLTALVIFCFSFDLYGSRRMAFALGVIFTGCSFILPYNNSLFPQPLQALCLVTAFFFLYKSRHSGHSLLCNLFRHEVFNDKRGLIYSGLAAFFFGSSIFASPISGLFIPAIVICSIIYLRHNKKLLLCFLVVLGMLLLSIGVVNYVRFGSFMEFGYGGGFGTLSYNSGWTGLVGLWLSPGKGLILYFPLVLLLPIALKFMYGHDKSLVLFTVYIVIAIWLYFGTLEPAKESRYWSGAPSWGPRYMIPALPFFVILLGALLRPFENAKFGFLHSMKVILVIVCVISFIINLPGILVWSEYGLFYAWTEERLGYDAMEIVTWDPEYSPIIQHYKILQEGYISDIPVGLYKDTDWDYLTYGLAPCKYDLYIFCKFGIVPLIILSAAAIFLTIIILRINRKEIYVYS
jgi:hypothetical protein